MICALAFAGCSQQHQKTITGPASVPDIGTNVAMEIAEDVLAKMHFVIEKADAASGYIRTKPLAGGQFFEFWRSDNVGSENTLLSNLHTIRRTVELNMIRQESQLEIDCDVRVQRLSLPEREAISTARAYGMYTRSSPTLQKMRFDATQVKGIEWIDLDKDTELAAEITRRIEERIARRASDESQAAESRT
ncbi:MAG: hypothetical protein JSW47_13085 [Phycisphaerales bacterium]|nr:MAG: hypothetical protein JSW47_13085 [Phycisphaerales bacterium]